MPLAFLNPITVVMPSRDLTPLILGNLLAGLVEYDILRWRFGLKGWRWLFVLVVVNLASAAIGGYPLQAWLPTWISRLNLGPLDQVPTLLVSAAVLTFLFALILEYPAYFAIFQVADVRRRQPLRALVVAHLVSWPVTLAMAVFLSRHEWDLSLYTQTHRVAVSSIAPPKTWIWYERNGRIFQQRLGDDGTRDLNVPTGEAQTLALDPSAGGWRLDMYAFAGESSVRTWGITIAPPTWCGPTFQAQKFLGVTHNEWKDKFLNWSLLRGENYFTAEAASCREVRISNEGEGAIELRTGVPNIQFLKSIFPLHRAWYGKSVRLPEGPIIFEIDQGMVLFDPVQKKVASLGRGDLVMVLREP